MNAEDGLAVVGAVCCVVGVWFMNPPMAAIVLGVFLLLTGFVRAFAKRDGE